MGLVETRLRVISGSSRPAAEPAEIKTTPGGSRPGSPGLTSGASAGSSRPEDLAGELYIPILLSGPTATPGITTATLAWTLSSAGPAGYHRARHRLSGEADWITESWSLATSWEAEVSLADLEDGETHDYQIESAAGPGGLWTMGWLPATPLTFETESAFTLVISNVHWTIGKTTLGVLYDTNAATKCRISYKKATDFLWQQLNIETTYHTGGHSHTLSGLTTATEYWIRIFAYDSAGHEDYAPSEAGYYRVKTHSSAGTGGGYIGTVT